MMERELFPREVTSKVPMITLTGRELLHVEQHKGLMVCREEEIVFRASCGLVVIRGTGLHFRRYSAAEALIAGNIDSVGFMQEGRPG